MVLRSASAVPAAVVFGGWQYAGVQVEAQVHGSRLGAQQGGQALSPGAARQLTGATESGLT